MVQLWTIPTCPIPEYWGESSASPSPCPLLRNCRELWGHPSASFSTNETSPKSSVPSNRTLPPALPSPLLPPQDTFSSVPLILQLWGPEQHTELKVRLPQGCTAWVTSVTAGEAEFDSHHEGVCPLGCQGALLAATDPACWPAHRGSLLYFGKFRNMNLCSGFQNYPGKPGLNTFAPWISLGTCISFNSEFLWIYRCLTEKSHQSQKSSRQVKGISDKHLPVDPESLFSCTAWH